MSAKEVGWPGKNRENMNMQRSPFHLIFLQPRRIGIWRAVARLCDRKWCFAWTIGSSAASPRPLSMISGNTLFKNRRSFSITTDAAFEQSHNDFIKNVSVVSSLPKTNSFASHFPPLTSLIFPLSFSPPPQPFIFNAVNFVSFVPYLTCFPRLLSLFC